MKTQCGGCTGCGDERSRWGVSLQKCRFPSITVTRCRFVEPVMASVPVQTCNVCSGTNPTTPKKTKWRQRNNKRQNTNMQNVDVQTDACRKRDKIQDNMRDRSQIKGSKLTLQTLFVTFFRFSVAICYSSNTTESQSKQSRGESHCLSIQKTHKAP